MSLPLWIALLASPEAEAVRPFAGLEGRPISREDLVWVDEGRTSGTGVGEFDGTVRPLMSAFGGVWFSKYVGLAFGVGLAQQVNATRVDDVYRQRFVGVFRPHVDLRVGWMEPRPHFPIPWVVVGAYGDVPFARDVSNAYTADEQEAADDTAQNERYRLGGVGGRVGAGVDYRLLPGLMIGAQFTVGLHRATYTGGDSTFAGMWVATEASLLLTFEWPETRKNRSTEPEGEGGVQHPAAVSGEEAP